MNQGPPVGVKDGTPRKFGWMPRILAVCGFAAMCFGCPKAEFRRDHPWRGSELTDHELYQTVSRRVQGGESYYDAAHQELAKRNYPWRTAVAWRMPTYAWALGWLESRGLIRFAAVVLVMAAALSAALAVRRSFGFAKSAGAGMVSATSLGWMAVPEALWFSEFWLGQVLTLSVSLTVLGWGRSGAAVGSCGLFLRELALPFGLAGGLWAWREKRRGEAWIWAAGLVGWASYYSFHCAMVFQKIGGLGAAEGERWLRWGGPEFLTEMTRALYPWQFLPRWTAAAVLTAAVWGWSACTSPQWRVVRLQAAVYGLLFSIVGQPFNSYWGWGFAPLWLFGLVFISGPLNSKRAGVDDLAPEHRSQRHPNFGGDALLNGANRAVGE